MLTGSSYLKQEAHTCMIPLALYSIEVRDFFTFVISAIMLALSIPSLKLQVLCFLVDLNFCVW